MNFPVQARRDAEEFQEMLRSVQQWEKEVKGISTLSTKSTKNTSSNLSNLTREKKDRIKGIDYSAWDKFNVDEALEEVDLEEQENQKKQQALNLKSKGNDAYLSGKYKDAIELYTQALKMEKKNPVFYINRAMCNLKLKAFKDAERDCSIALNYDKFNIKALWRRGIALRNMERFKEALVDFEKAQEIEPLNKTILAEIEFTRQFIGSRIIEIEEIGREKEYLLQHETFPLDKLNNETVKLSKSGFVKCLPAPPINAIDFIRDWKSLCDDETRYLYIKSIDNFGILKNCMEPSHVASFIESILNHYQKNESYEDTIKILEELALTDRFEMNMMFLKSSLKQGLRELFANIKSLDGDLKAECEKVQKLYKC